jgi:Uncharacterised protein family UPF0547
MTPDEYYGFIVLFLAVCFGLLTAKIASDKGGSFVLWFVAGAFLAIVALPLAIFLSQEQIAPRSFKACPKCAERVQRAALVCKHCGYEFTAYDDLKIT